MDNTQQFSDRVDDYKKYRPNYPSEIIFLLKQQCELNHKTTVADVGSGTGIFTKLLLPHAKMVYAVEPNDAMRKTAEQLLPDETHFKSVNGTAEDTTLQSDGLDIVIAAQAFHWFDHERAKREFIRILKENGHIVLIWNDRNTEQSDFIKAYEELLLTYIPEYAHVNAHNIPKDVFDHFYYPNTWKLFTFTQCQIFDFDGLKGRFCSSSYTPKEGHPSYSYVIRKLKHLYERYQINSTIRFEYMTKVYIGKHP